ncbi:hypothetical protein PCASD_19849 [Puccinia coronata f. sp. avenae]|uniref:Uncharacterized protein n=1 Tax=Puccinia coronata f. sp. avenae TaxID=200324 RepID=A0A2N5SL09_9BASI|nr:hypothetical protein PCASD_19849 [Puccinia coronata f. sp. avenae]
MVQWQTNIQDPPESHESAGLTAGWDDWRCSANVLPPPALCSRWQFDAVPLLEVAPTTASAASRSKTHQEIWAVSGRLAQRKILQKAIVDRNQRASPPADNVPAQRESLSTSWQLTSLAVEPPDQLRKRLCWAANLQRSAVGPKTAALTTTLRFLERSCYNVDVGAPPFINLKGDKQRKKWKYWWFPSRDNGGCFTQALRIEGPAQSYAWGLRGREVARRFRRALRARVQGAQSSRGLRASSPRTLNRVPFPRLQTRVKKCGPTAGPIWVPSLQPTSNFMVASPHLGTAKSP